MTETEARLVYAAARKPMDIYEAIGVLRSCKHRNLSDWAEEVLRPDTSPRIVSRDPSGDLRVPSFNRFEAIAIATRYIREGLCQ